MMITRAGRMRLLSLAVVAVTVTATAACGGAAKKSSSAASNASSRASAGLVADAPPGVTAPAAAPRTGEPVAAARSIVRTADMRVRVGYARDAADKAAAIADSAGGYVASQESGGAGHAEARVVLKVPPARFGDVVDQVAALGTVLERSSTAADVTEQVVDLDGRLKTAQASADRLRALMARSGSAPEIASVEAELARREAEIESLAGQQRVLANQVDLATVNARFTEHGQAVTVSRNIPGFGRGLSVGWAALVNTTKVVVAFVGALLPFAVVAALGYGLIAGGRRLGRRFRRRRAPS